MFLFLNSVHPYAIYTPEQMSTRDRVIKLLNPQVGLSNLLSLTMHTNSTWLLTQIKIKTYFKSREMVFRIIESILIYKVKPILEDSISVVPQNLFWSLLRKISFQI